MLGATMRLLILVIAVATILCPWCTGAILSGTNLASTPTTVVRFGPVDNNGCMSEEGVQLELFEVPVVTNFPLPQFYCGILATPTPGHSYRIVSDDGWVLCVEEHVVQRLACWAPTTTTNPSCEWIVGQGNIAWSGEESIELITMTDGTYKVMLENGGVMISDPSGVQGVEALVGPDIAGLGRSWWSGRGAGGGGKANRTGDGYAPLCVSGCNSRGHPRCVVRRPPRSQTILWYPANDGCSTGGMAKRQLGAQIHNRHIGRGTAREFIRGAPRRWWGRRCYRLGRCKGNRDILSR